MAIWNLLLIICAAGAVGGIVNALMTDNGFVMPLRETTDGATIVRPGFFGNVVIGAVAAGISWGLYGPLTNQFIFGGPAEAKAGITLSALVGAALVGIGGARWLTNEVDKKLLKAAATKAARSKSNPSAGDQIAQASPAEALKIAKKMPTS